MKRDTRMTGIARIIGLLIVFVLLLSLLLPIVGAAAQEAGDDEATTEALSEVPHRNQRRRPRAWPPWSCRSTASASTPRLSLELSPTERCRIRAVPGSSPGTTN